MAHPVYEMYNTYIRGLCSTREDRGRVCVRLARYFGRGVRGGGWRRVESPESEAKQIRKMASLLWYTRICTKGGGGSGGNLRKAVEEGGRGSEGFCCSFFGHDQLRHHTGRRRHHPFLERAIKPLRGPFVRLGDDIDRSPLPRACIYTMYASTAHATRIRSKISS